MATDKISEPTLLTTIPMERQLSTIRFSPCGKFLFAAGRDAKIYRWDVSADPAPPPGTPENPDKKAKPPALVYPSLSPLAGHDGWVSHFVFSPQGQRLFSADSWGRLICWPYADAAPAPAWNVKDAHDGWIRQVALSADGSKLATCGLDKIVRLWSPADGKKVLELTGQGEDILSVAFHPDGQSLVAGDLKGIVKQWDLASGKIVREFDAKVMYLLSFIQDVGGVRVLAFDPTGKTLAVAGAQPTTGGFVQAIPLVKFFDWPDGKETSTLKLGENTEGYVHDLAYHPDGFWIGCCSGQPGRGKYFLHRAGEAQPAVSKALPNCHSVALHPQGDRLAVIANEGTFGQRKSMAREGIYPGNTSPIHVFSWPKVAA